MRIVVGFLGSPSSGKTSLSARLHAALKDLGIDVEYSPELVKNWVYEGRKIGKYGQYVLFGQEVMKQSTLFNSVSVTIVDSPVVLTGFYQYYYNGDNTLSEACHGFYEKAKEDGVKIINFFLPRKKGYVKKGRYQTEAEADQVAIMLKNWLKQEGYDYVQLDCTDEERLDKVMSYLKDLTNDFEGMRNE